MKLFLLFILVAASTGRLLEKSIKVAEGSEELFGGFLDPKSRAFTPRYIGGENASPGEFPYQVSLQVAQGSSRFHICGGSILANDKIATAAHCCDNQNVQNLRVVAGAHDLQTQEPSQQILGVSRIVLHPDYDSNTINNDACKVFLDTSLELNDRVATIEICSSEPIYGTCVGTGWGTTSNSAQILPPQLQKLNMSVVSRSDCQSNYLPIASIMDSMLCVGGTEGESACTGDSGGPVVCGGCLAGATSFGMVPCGQSQFPTVYANAANLRSFYESN